jgi:hypothetical protein
LEEVNEQLVFALTRCVELLTQLQPTQADQEKYAAIPDKPM